MSLRSAAIKIYSGWRVAKLNHDIKNPIECQEKIFSELLTKGRKTAFGRDHNFDKVDSYEKWIHSVPLRKYQEYEPYIDRIFKGEDDVLWPGRPMYFVGTAGTTGGVKYIPLTGDSLPYHLGTARDAVIYYCMHHGLMDIFDGKMLFLSGSPVLQRKNGYKVGRLSGIVNHEIPAWLRYNHIPDYRTNAIDDWKEKVDRIGEICSNSDLRMISGITPWIMMFIDNILEKTSTSDLSSLFKSLRLVVHGGVKFDPYNDRLTSLCGKGVHFYETYPSSEGFVAFQDPYATDQLLLNVNGGVFYEFVVLSGKDLGQRCRLQEVEVDQEYEVIINNNAGLWGSRLGDTIKFTSTDPYRLVFTGRTEQFLSAFGEHIVASDVEIALSRVMIQTNDEIVEFTVSPMVVSPDGGLPYHEWLIEFACEPRDLDRLETLLDAEMHNINFHYKDLVTGQVIRPLKIRYIVRGSFVEAMAAIGRLGGQNKAIHISNDREFAEQVLECSKRISSKKSIEV